MSDTGLKTVNREGPTGPPNNTKEALQLFGENTSFHQTLSSPRKDSMQI